MRKKLSWLPAMTLVVTLLAPTGAMAAGPIKELDYKDTRAAAAEKAALLTQSLGTTSVQYALIDHGKIIASGQAGRNDEKGKKPLTAETMYGIGSVSKMFVTAAVMRLVDEGKIDLDTPVVKYIPEFTMKDERYKQITPRMLLNYSSGLRGDTSQNTALFNDNDTYAHDHLLQQLAQQTLKADPGAYSSYGNDGITLAEIMTEKVSGMDFTSYIHRYFTKPLGMSNTKTPLDKLNSSNIAGAYAPVYNGQLPNGISNNIGAVGIFSTAEDMAKFSQIFTGEAGGILSDESVNAMEQEESKKGIWPQDKEMSDGFGLGWDSVNLFPFGDYGIKAVKKAGDTAFFHSSLVVLPDQDMAAVVLTSGSWSGIDQIFASDMLLHALKENGTISSIKPDKSYANSEKAAMPEDMLQYAGVYGATNQLLQAAINKDGSLMLLAGNTPPAKFMYTADGSFVSEDGNMKISFVTEKNGRTYIWTRQYIVVPGMGQLRTSEYTAEKLSANEITEETASAWKERQGKKYYLLNEKYSSQLYGIMYDLGIYTFFQEFVPGYAFDKKITGPNSAVNDLQIPNFAGRGNMEYNFYTQDGIEYLDIGGSLLVREEAVKPIYAGKNSVVTIQQDGYAKWYTIPDGISGKSLKVNKSSHSSFTVYDEKGALVNFSVITGDNKVVLSKGGSIVFAGDAGSKFEVIIK